MPRQEELPNLSLSDMLGRRRKVLKISLDELSKKTSVPVKHLRRIESGQWSALPSSVYTKGFLRRYAAVVGINPEDVIYKYENEILQKASSLKIKNKERARFNFQPTVSARSISVAGIIIVLIFVLGYIGYQFSAVLAHPRLLVESPAEVETVINIDNLILKGGVSKGADLTLNNQAITVNPDGFFEHKVELLPGINTFEIKAISRFGKETTIIRRVIYNP